jgi:hypothetical protein
VENMAQDKYNSSWSTQSSLEQYYNQLSIKIVKYQAQTVEVKEILSAPMDQHRFPYANTYEELFVKWSKYEKIHPLQ